MSRFRGSKLPAILFAGLACVAPFLARGQAVRPGAPTQGASPQCQFNPQLGVGDSSPCNSKIPWEFTANSSASSCLSNSVNVGFGNGTALVGDADANFNKRIFVAAPIPTNSPTPSAYMPGVCAYDRSTGTFIASGPVNGGTNICYGGNNHAEPAMVDLSGGYVAVTACGPNSGHPGQWGGTGSPGFGAGTSFPAMPFAIGNCVGTTDCTAFGTGAMDISSSANLFYAPGQGLSETSGGQWGGVTLICGQSNGNDFQTAINTGAQGCTTLHRVPGLAQWTTDTACSPGASLTSYNIVTGTLSAACNAEFTFQYNVHSDDIGWQDFTGNSAGTSTTTFPVNGSFTSKSCTLATSGTATTDATNYAAAIHTGTGFGGAGCTGTSLTNFWDAYVITACGLLSPCTANQTVMVMAKNANPPAMNIISTSSTGTLAAWHDARSQTSGQTNHFSYGTFQLLYTTQNYPLWCGVIDNQVMTSNYSGTIVAANGYALNVRILCSHGPGYTISNGAGTAGVWHWGTAEVAKAFGSSPADGFDQTVSPATTNNVAVGATPGPGNNTIFIGPSTSCTDAANTACQSFVDSTGVSQPIWGFVRQCDGVVCTKPALIPPFSFDMTSATQAAMAFNNGDPPPIFSNYGLLVDANNNIGWYYACPDTNAAGARSMICYATVSASTGQTLQQVVVDQLTTNTTTWLPNVIGTRAPSGDLVLLSASQEGGVITGCASHNPCFIQHVSTDNGAHWTNTVLFPPSWTSTTPTAILTCSLNADPKGWHLYAGCWNGTGTSGTTSYFQYDLFTGDL